MSHTTITWQLPDNLVNEASASELFEPATIEKLLREELRRRRIDRLFEVEPLSKYTDSHCKRTTQSDSKIKYIV